MKKLLTTLTLFAALALTACGGKGGDGGKTSSRHVHTAAEGAEWKNNETKHWKDCKDNDGGQVDSQSHQWVSDTSKTDVAATCAAAGTKYEVCSVCGYKRETSIPQLEHVWGDPYDVVEATCAAEGSYKVKCNNCDTVETRTSPKAAHDWESQGNSAAVEGAVATEQFKCKLGDHYALRWSAQDMDEAASVAACGLEAKDTTYYAEVNTSGSHNGSIRLRKAENDQGTKAFGTHCIYKVNLGAEATDIDLSFQIDPKSGYDVPVFDYVDGDAQQGYREKADGSLELTTKRYGLKVNGVDVELGEDLHGKVNGGSKLWFNWNVKMNLTAGINTIDVYCLGGYRAYIYNFQLDGLTSAQLPAKAA